MSCKGEVKCEDGACRIDKGPPHDDREVADPRAVFDRYVELRCALMADKQILDALSTADRFTEGSSEEAFAAGKRVAVRLIKTASDLAAFPPDGPPDPPPPESRKPKLTISVSRSRK